MESKSVVFFFATIFASILFLAIVSVVWDVRGNGLLLGICFFAGGGIVMSFIPLVIEKIGKYRQAKKHQ